MAEQIHSGHMGQFASVEVIYEDNHLLVVNKPAGLGCQEDQSGDRCLTDLAKDYIKEKYNKPGAVYLGLIHRLDRPVSGVICLARTSKAAARLSKQFQNHNTEKRYCALTPGQLPKNGAIWEDLIGRRDATAFITKKASEGKKARLSWTLLTSGQYESVADIALDTGRHHQIRIQFASRGYPLVGDFRYGSKVKFGDRAVALHAYSLTIDHPVTKERMTFKALPNRLIWPDEVFENL